MPDPHEGIDRDSEILTDGRYFPTIQSTRKDNARSRWVKAQSPEYLVDVLQDCLLIHKISNTSLLKLQASFTVKLSRLDRHRLNYKPLNHQPLQRCVSIYTDRQ